MTHAPSMAELARQLGISRETLYQVARRKGCPKKEAKGLCVQAWREFAAGHVDKLSPGAEEKKAAGGGTEAMTLSELKGEKIRVEIARLNLKLEVERGELAPVASLTSLIAEILQRHMGNLYRQATGELPAKLEGRKAADIAEANRAALDEYFRATQEELGNAVDECRRQSLAGSAASA